MQTLLERDALEDSTDLMVGLAIRQFMIVC